MEQLNLLDCDDMNYTNKICSFSGYRAAKLSSCLSESTLTMQDIEQCLKIRMLEMLDEGFATFRCGMANGADLLFAQIVLQLQKEYHGLIKLVAAIPCLNHDKGWSEKDRALCREITEQADEKVIVSDSPYYDGCMAKRNRYLINGCDELLAVYDGQRGGTMQTINYAKGKNIKITIVDPSREVIITLRESQEFEKSIKGVLL